MESSAAALVSLDIVSLTGRFFYSWGYDRRYIDLYLEKYIKLNPARVPITFIKAGDVRSISDLVPFDEFRRSQIYNEWVKPQGWADGTIGMLDKSATTATHLTIAHDAGDSPASEAARHRISLLIPHLRRAVSIAKIIDLHKVEAGALAEAVDAIAAGVILVGEGAHIIRANTSGRAMLAAGDVVRVAEGRLVAAELSADQALHHAITGAADGDTGVGSRGVAIPLISSSGEPLVAHVLPLAVGTRRQAGLSRTAIAAVFIHKAALEGPTPFEAISRHFGLTRAELRILVAIVEAGGVPQVAPVLGVSETTVRWHLRHLFEKTGASRQADLVKLVAGFVNPLLRG